LHKLQPEYPPPFTSSITIKFQDLRIPAVSFHGENLSPATVFESMSAFWLLQPWLNELAHCEASHNLTKIKRCYSVFAKIATSQRHTWLVSVRCQIIIIMNYDQDYYHFQPRTQETWKHV
jgi:hypothetical protein